MKKYILLLVMILGAYNGFAQNQDSIAKMENLNQLADESDYVFEGQIINTSLYTVYSDKRTYGASYYKVLKVHKGNIQIGDTISWFGESRTTFQMESKDICRYNFGNVHASGPQTSGVFILFCKKNTLPLDFKEICGPRKLDAHLKLNITDPWNCGFVKHILEKGYSFDAPFDAPLHTYNEIQDWLDKTFTHQKKSKKKENVASKSKAMLMIIDSIYPKNISAGNFEYLFIRGSGFGSTVGKVLFKDANRMPESEFTKGLDSFYISPFNWTDTLIKALVPSIIKNGYNDFDNPNYGTAGSGKVKVVVGSDSILCSDSITIAYALTNIILGTVDNISPKRVYLTKETSSCNDGLTITLHNYYNTPSKAIEIAAIEEAFNQWHLKNNFKFILQKDNVGNYVFTNDTISATENIIYNTSWNALMAATPAYTKDTFLNKYYLSGASIYINESYPWHYNHTDDIAVGEYDFLNTFLHELGHVLTNMHTYYGSNAQDELMYYAVPPAPSIIPVSNRINLFDSESEQAILCVDTTIFYSTASTLAWSNNLQIFDNTTPIISDLVLHDCPCDDGGEPNTIDCNATNATCSDDIGYNSIFFSNDIWNKASIVTDFTTMDKTHEPPTNYTLSSTQNTIAAELKNNSTCGSPAGNLKFYWAMGSTGEMWDVDWINHLEYCTFPPIVTGDSLGTVHIPTDDISINTSKKYGMQWSPPSLATMQTCYPDESTDGEADGQWEICLLARFESTDDPIIGETMGSIGANVRASNNIVTRNTFLMELAMKNIRIF